MLKKQENLKRLTIEVPTLQHSIFEIIGKYCRNLEFLTMCYSMVSFVSHRLKSIHITNELIIKNVIIKKFGICHVTYFPSNLIQACKALVSLDIEGKLFQFVSA